MLLGVDLNIRLFLCLVFLLAACSQQDAELLEPAAGTEGSSDAATEPISGDPTAVLATVAVANTETPVMPTPVTPTEAPELTITPLPPKRVLTTGIR